MIRKLVSILLLFCLMLSTSCALAETRITVDGTGEVLVSADTAVVSLGVSVRDEDALAAQAGANETIAAIRSILNENGFPEEDINTGMISIYTVYDYADGVEKSLYQAYSTLAIRTTRMDRVGTVIDLAFKAGANMLDGVSFSASDTSAAEAEALTAAVAEARTHAEILAAAAGMTVTRIEAITEGNSYSYDTGANNFSIKTAEQAYRDSDTVVRSAKLCVTGSVTVVFIAE